MSRIRIARLVEGKRTELRVKLDDIVQPGDTIIVPERLLMTDPNVSSTMPMVPHQPAGSPARAMTATQRGPVYERTLADVHLLDYVRLLYKRRWAASTMFLLVLLAAIVQIFTTTPVYEARTRILIESNAPNIVSFKEVIDQAQAQSDYYRPCNVLQSRTLARDTIEDLQLWNSPLLSDPDGRFSKIGALVRRLVPFAHDRGATIPEPIDQSATQSRVMNVFLENLTIAPVRNSRLVDIRFRLQDPAKAAAVANSIAENYIQQSLVYKFTASRDASDWLQGQLAEQRGQVETAELALQKYREQNDAISLEDRQNIVVQKLADVNAAVTRAKTERLLKEATYSTTGSRRSGSNAARHVPGDPRQHVHPATEV